MRASMLFLMGLSLALAGCGNEASNQTVSPGRRDVTIGERTRAPCDRSGGAGCEPVHAFRMGRLSLLDPQVHLRGQCESGDLLTQALNESLGVLSGRAAHV